MYRFAKEGYPFILSFIFITVLTAVLNMHWLSAVSLLLTIFMFYFFRDPERLTLEDPNAFIAPADGKIIGIATAKEDEMLNADALRISIFMSPLNVHVNRVPCDGTVKKVTHYPGKFYKAYTDDAAVLNEHITMLYDAKQHGDIVLKQIAGSVARRCVCRVSSGAAMKQGERYGIIKFSSRVDIFLPLDTKVKIKLNDLVTAGETVLAIRD